MDLILWRHAEAEEGLPDLARELTGRGRKQASRMADWLTPRLPPDVRILASPAVRTRQTAQALGREVEIDESLAPGASAEAVLAAAGWPDAVHPVLIVGHQPTLGRVAARLLAGVDGDPARDADGDGKTEGAALPDFLSADDESERPAAGEDDERHLIAAE